MQGAGRAEAAPDFVLNVTTNAATAETRLTSNPAINAPVLAVSQGGGINATDAAIAASISGSVTPAISAVGFSGGPGVLGRTLISSGAFSAGVKGEGTLSGHTGVLGEISAVAAAGFGVDGLSKNAGGIGVRGRGQNNGTGVQGFSSALLTNNGDGSGIGVQGRSGSGPGVEGISTNGLGVRGISTTSVAMVGISTGNHGLYGSTSSASAAGFVGENLAGGLAGYFAGNVFITGSLQVAGAKNAVIRMQDGTTASVYCQESPEPYFEDFGRAQLAGGVANVTLEREFASLVAGGDYMVFPVPGGDTRGLYVSRQGPTGFEVRECQGGTASIPFTYRVVTKRKDIEGRRFARVTDEVGKTLAASRAAVRVGATPPAQPSSQNPVSPPPFVPNAPAPPVDPTQPSSQPQPIPPANPDQSGLLRPR